MFFRNLTFFRFPRELDLEDIGESLATRPLKPIGPLELSTRGFVPPLGRDTEALSHRIGDAIWVAAGGEDKILPPSVINAELLKKLDEAEEREGRRPGGRARKRMKEELVHELLPRAFAKPMRTDGYLDLGRGFFVIDASSRKVAESVVSMVRNALGSFPALPISAEISPRGVLTAWLAGETLPDGLTMGDACQLAGGESHGPKVTIRNLELNGDEVAAHLEAGLQCTRLALVLDDHLTFELDEDLVVRKLKFLDGAVEALEEDRLEDLHAELDARFALQAGEVGRLFDVLASAFKVSAVDGEDMPAPAAARPRRRGSLDGIDSVTISSPGVGSVTLTAEQFREAPERMKEVARAADLVRESGTASVAHLQRHMKLGYNAAARLIETLEGMGVVSAPGADGHRTVIRTQG